MAKLTNCTVHSIARVWKSEYIHNSIWLTAGIWRGQVGLISCSFCKGQARCLVDQEPLLCAQNASEPGRLKWSPCRGGFYFAGQLSISLLQNQQNPGAGAEEAHTKTRCNSSIALLLINNADELGPTSLSSLDSWLHRDTIHQCSMLWLGVSVKQELSFKQTAQVHSRSAMINLYRTIAKC